ncbi:MAG: phosphatase PAP2 family protein [Betaproteobacteria bacterium]
MNPDSTERAFWRSVAWVTSVTLALLLALEWTTLDLALARLSYDAERHAFPLREHFVTTRVAHEGVKVLSWLVFGWIAVSAWRPVGPLRRLDRAQRLYLLGAAVTCLVVVALLKRTSALHCPWGLAEFGGAHPYLRLLDPVPPGWQRGACFPAGHALSAFAYIGGFFAWRGADRRAALAWLGAVLLVGAFAGVSQQLRGAHFLSHTLWTAWLCWTLSAAIAWRARGRLRGVNAREAPSL